MHNFFNSENFGLLVPIFGMLIPIVAIISGVVQSWQSEAQRHETIRELARNGQPIPPELLQRGRIKVQVNGDNGSAANNDSTARVSASLRKALILIAVGMGVCAALYIVAPVEWLWGFGLIPLFLGIAYLVIWKIEASSAR